MLPAETPLASWLVTCLPPSGVPGNDLIALLMSCSLVNRQLVAAVSCVLKLILAKSMSKKPRTMVPRRCARPKRSRSADPAADVSSPAVGSGGEVHGSPASEVKASSSISTSHAPQRCRLYQYTANYSRAEGSAMQQQQQQQQLAASEICPASG